MRWIALLVALLVALAGCSSSSDDMTDDGMDATGDGGAGSPVQQQTQVIDPLADAPAVPTGWFMAADETIHEGGPEKETAEEYKVSSSHNAATGEPFDFYMGEAPQYDYDLVITAATIDLTMRFDSVSVDPAPVFGVSGVGTVLAGSTSSGLITFLEAPAPVQGYEGYAHWNQPMVLPPGGLVVPKDDFLSLVAASLYINPDDVAGAVFLMNSADYPSGITANAKWTVLPATQEPERVLTGSDAFNAAGCGSGATEGTSKFSYPVDVGGDVVGLVVTATGANNADIDLYITGGGKTAGSNLPASPETVRLYAPNLEAFGTDTLTVEIHNCQDPGQGNTIGFDVTVDVLRAVPDTTV